MINPTEADIGRAVIYQGGHPDDREEGVITSFNAHVVFVRYGNNRHGQGTSRDDLSWSHPVATEAVRSPSSDDAQRSAPSNTTSGTEE